MRLRYFLLMAVSFIFFAVFLSEMEIFYLLGLYGLTDLMAVPMAASFYVFFVSTLSYIVVDLLRAFRRRMRLRRERMKLGESL